LGGMAGEVGASKASITWKRMEAALAN
jgi:hypothetical protein